MRTHQTQGKGKDRMKQFKAAWERFAGDEANLVEFLNAKRPDAARGFDQYPGATGTPQLKR